MLEKIKQYGSAIGGFLLLILTGAFLYERSRADSAEAVADNKEVLDKINDLERQKAANDGKLEAEESKREDIKKEVEDAKANPPSDVAADLNKLLK